MSGQNVLFHLDWPDVLATKLAGKAFFVALCVVPQLPLGLAHFGTLGARVLHPPVLSLHMLFHVGLEHQFAAFHAHFFWNV